MSKTETITLERAAGSGVERELMNLEHAQNLLRLSEERGWGWHVPENSDYEYDRVTAVLRPKAKKSARKSKKK